MRLYLDVPYLQKEEAKQYGARWDGNEKKWFFDVFYDTEEDSVKPLIKWLKNPMILMDLYIVESKRICYKCKKETKVIALGTSSFFDIEKDDDIIYINKYERTDGLYLLWFYDVEGVPSNVFSYLKDRFYIEYMYSQTIQDKAVYNYCEHCRSIQGNFHLFNEPDESPFNDEFDDNIEKMKIYNMNCRNAISFNGFNFGTLNIQDIVMDNISLDF